MKKHMSRNTILMVVLDLVLGIVLSLYIANTGTVPAADNAATYTDGTYTASAKGCLSDVAVTVTITGGKVTGVNIDASGERPRWEARRPKAWPSVCRKPAAQLVDAVSGSTMTSDAIFTAMDDCLAQAAQ